MYVFFQLHFLVSYVEDDDPICQSNVGLHDVIGQNACNLKRDEVNISCSVTYHGNIPPRIGWERIEDDINITGTISRVVSANTYTSTLILENDITLHNSAYVCQINGTTENQYKCISKTIRLACELNLKSLRLLCYLIMNMLSIVSIRLHVFIQEISSLRISINK